MAQAFISNEETRHLVDRQLVTDLIRISIEKDQGFEIDWSKAQQEGGGCVYNGEYLESASEINVLKEGRPVYFGWVDYVLDRNNKLYSYWTVLNSVDTKKELYQDFGIPDPMWEKFSEEERLYLAEKHQGWRQDKKMFPYRKVVITKKIEELVPKLESILTEIDFYSLPEGFDLNLYKDESKTILDLAHRFLTGELLSPTISTHSYKLYRDNKNLILSESEESSENYLRILMELENEVRYAAIALSNKGTFLYYNAVPILFDRFPEFKSSDQYNAIDIKFPYAIYPDFCKYLVEKINSLSNPESDRFVQRAFGYLNEMLDHSDDYYWRELTYAGTFECLLEYKKVTDLAKKMLSSKGIEWFEDAPNWFKTPLK
jgi:hypothetical protein